MLVLGFFLVVIAVAYLIYFVQFEVAAFRQGIWWGLGTLFLWPVHLVFLVLHWKTVRKPFFGMLACGIIAGAGIGAFFATNPEEFTTFAKAAGIQLSINGQPAPKREAPPGPREARDLAATEAPSPKPPTRPTPAPVDPFAVQRAACAKHAADLNAIYADLNKERAKLKKGSPAVAAFNVKAAKYQDGLRALAAERAQLDALDRPAAAALTPAAPVHAPNDPKEAEANAALLRLRALATQGDYPAFAETLKKCLGDYRQTAAFPQIAAVARETLAGATPDKLAAAVQARGTAARAERDAALGRVRAIVNQTPPTVPKPPAGAEVYHYGYHPGALTPDYAHADLLSTREVYRGDFIYMDTAPGIYYRAGDCEFNPQTKFFLTNRDVPTKKLTDAEIAEVVRLYRTIATDEELMSTLPQRLHDAQGASADLLALNKQLAASR